MSSYDTPPPAPWELDARNGDLSGRPSQPYQPVIAIVSAPEQPSDRVAARARSSRFDLLTTSVALVAILFTAALLIVGLVRMVPPC